MLLLLAGAAGGAGVVGSGGTAGGVGLRKGLLGGGRGGRRAGGTTYCRFGGGLAAAPWSPSLSSSEELLKRDSAVGRVRLFLPRSRRSRSCCCD